MQKRGHVRLTNQAPFLRDAGKARRRDDDDDDDATIARAKMMIIQERKARFGGRFDGISGGLMAGGG